MTKQLLVAVNSIEDAQTAAAAIPEVCKEGDECVVLAVLHEPDTELLGSTPAHVIPEPYTGAGGSEGPRAPNDAPVFLPREEVREMTARDVSEAIDRLTQPLRDGGIRVRAETLFSESPARAIADYAGDIDAQVMVTRRFSEELADEDAEGLVASVLPGT